MRYQVLQVKDRGFTLKSVRVTPQLLITSLMLFFFSLMLFLVNIQHPNTHNFDEFHYVPAAKQFLELDPVKNLEHPPLGKLIMAVGISIFGDQPVGWRIMSTVFGALTLVGMFILGWVIFKSEAMALWVALITLFNQLLYVQARIGMLDTFMFGFLVWALALFCATWDPSLGKARHTELFGGAGIFFGLAIASKWFAIVPWAACIGLIGGVSLLQGWGTYFKTASDEDWFTPTLWTQVPKVQIFLLLGVLPLIVYWLTFLPFVFIPGSDMSFVGFWNMQIRMWSDQHRVVSAHPYMSTWLEWPLLSRPIWYAFDREGANNEWVRGVLLLGNPAVMWGGLIALMVCLWNWVKNRSRVSFIVLFLFAITYLCWACIPRNLSFYYYYYPAGMILGLALAHAFDLLELHLKQHSPWLRWIIVTPRWGFLILAVGIFIYFFPVLGALRIPSESFIDYMWSRSWI